MKAVRGHYNGSVVVLDEPAPIGHAVQVLVEFPDDIDRRAGSLPKIKRYSWAEAQAIDDGHAGSLAEEVVRQRRLGPRSAHSSLSRRGRLTRPSQPDA